MQEDREALEELMVVPEVIRIKVSKDGNRRIEESAPLKLLYSEERDALLLSHDQFMYALNKSIPVFTNTRPDDCYIGKRYIISLGEEQIAFVFGAHIDSKHQKEFEELVNEYSALYFANDGKEPEWIDGVVYADEKLADSLHKSAFFSKEVQVKTDSSKETQDDCFKIDEKEPQKIGRNDRGLAPNNLKKASASRSKSKGRSPSSGSKSAKIGDFLAKGGDYLLKGITMAGMKLGSSIRNSKLL